MVGERAAGASRVTLRFTALMLALALCACSDATGPNTGLPADTAHGPGLLRSWSELSGKIAYATNDQVVLIDAVHRQVKLLYRPLADETVVDVATSQDGGRVGIASILTSGGMRTSIIDANTGALLFARTNESCPRWLRDGRLSTVTGAAVHLETALAVQLPRPLQSCPTWSIDGTWLAAAITTTDAKSTEIARADLSTGAIRTLIPQPAAGAWYDPAISPNGQSIALVQAGTSENTDIYLANSDGSNLRRIASAFRLFGLSWSPDGTMLLGVSTASSNGSYDKAGLFIVDAKNGTVRKLANHPVYAAAWGS
jgi:hypothetical protein